MKVLVVPDKFKGSLNSFELCNAIAEGLADADPNINCLRFPMADGGDGFSAVMQHYLQTITITSASLDPLGRPVNATWQWQQSQKTAIIEVAAASGLALLSGSERDPMRTNTVGTGILIQQAIDKNAATILLGLGGSATNDAGTGILHALGFRFIDNNDREIQPSGASLDLISDIIVPEPLPSIRFVIASDVQNVMFGENGAAYIYGPQKGATPEMVKMLDLGLRNFAKILEQKTNKKISDKKGMGAAGAIAAGVLSFFPGETVSGTELIVKVSGLREHLIDADLLITGEGSLDSQSGEGKVVGYMAALAKQHQLKCYAICGSVNLSEGKMDELGIHKAIAIREHGMSLEEAVRNAHTLVRKRTMEIIHS